MAYGYISEIFFFSEGAKQGEEFEPTNHLMNEEPLLLQGEYEGAHKLVGQLAKNTDHQDVVFLSLFNDEDEELDTLEIPVDPLFMSHSNHLTKLSTSTEIDLQPDKALVDIYLDNWDKEGGTAGLEQMNEILDILFEGEERPPKLSSDRLQARIQAKLMIQSFREKSLHILDQQTEQRLHTDKNEQESKDFKVFTQKLEEKWLRPNAITNTQIINSALKNFFTDICAEVYFEHGLGDFDAGLGHPQA
tara:strand:+ start:1130 stop:1870 length:741 start_codon:yes stop_codon:yes gene_type:complete